MEIGMSSDIEDFWEKLKTQRDEMKVQAHLARAEFRDEWNAVEEKWQKAEQAFDRVQDRAIETTAETTAEMQHSAKVIMEEIASTYDRIKERLDH
jgi:DNA repair exonuclease SbcCD ATPase subunit